MNFEVIRLYKGKNNGCYYASFRNNGRIMEYSFSASFKLYGGVVINIATMRPPTREEMDELCQNFSGMDSYSEARKTEMMNAFKDWASALE